MSPFFWPRCRRFAGFAILLTVTSGMALGESNHQGEQNGCAFMSEQLAALATPTVRLPGMDEVRTEQLPAGPTVSQQGMLNFCAGYLISREYTLEVLASDDGADPTRRRQEILLAFRSESETAAYFRIWATEELPRIQATGGTRGTSRLLDTPSLGDECIAVSNEKVHSFVREGVRGTITAEQSISLVFRRSRVMALTFDRFSGGRLDIPLAVALAEELDARIAQASQ